MQPRRSRYREKDLQPVTVWAVEAHEDQPPPGAEAVSWMLLTTVPVTNHLGRGHGKNPPVHLLLAI